MASPRPIVVLGAGIIGLTTAVKLLESPVYKLHGHPVHIIADHLPNDPLDAKYASTIAGAHHLSFAGDDDTRQSQWDRETFRVMHDEWSKEGEATGLMLLKQTEFYVGTSKHLKIYEEHPDFEIRDVKGKQPTADYSVSFTSITMTPLTYLNRLLKRIDTLSDGACQIHRFHLQSLDEVSHPAVTAFLGTAPPLAVFVCTGLGALTLGGVEDKTVFPTRGQVVKVRAPWIRSGFTRQVGDLNGGEDGERTYVIPRPDGEVILGGTREIGDWYPYPRPDTSGDIIRRVLEICPDLQPAHRRAKRGETVRGQSVDDSNSSPPSSPLEDLIVTHLVGFRPSREQGVRLEVGPDLILNGQRNIHVVYNYGHGGAGWQSCWGTASDAVKILETLL
ncbi:FAD dependent oxidoreductase [Naematelia encephala]|uniref:FAD dependent oxidoreductase n=1 Tax=Naematelia encephala TaxID=71784 RepID=A0A1Y2AF27_9TREE|nr:FAD dependent oxidoreductase [Naematelia encephala]